MILEFNSSSFEWRNFGINVIVRITPNCNDKVPDKLSSPGLETINLCLKELNLVRNNYLRTSLLISMFVFTIICKQTVY